MFFSTEKKPKAAKEKPVVSSDGMSDLFAQMSLKGSSHLEPLVSSRNGLTVLETDSDGCTTATSQLIKDLNCQEVQPASNRSSFTQQAEAPASPSLTGTLSQTQSSLSVSVVIDELHLSSIDWDALSFAAAPSPQPQHSKSDSPPVNKSDEETKTEAFGSFTAVRADCVELAAQHADRPSERSLKERVHLRNMMKKSQVQSDGSGQKYTDGHEPLSEKPKAPPHSQPETSRINIDSKEKTFTKTQQHKDSLTVRMPPKYKFVKPKNFNRPSNYREQANKESVCKKSVCRRQESTGDKSDVENQPQSNLKTDVKPKPRTVQKTVSVQQQHEQNETRCKIFTNSVDTHHRSESTPQRKQPHNTGFSRTNPLVQTCSIKSDDDDDDDSDTSISSPLPLTERLKLKLNK